MNPGESYGAVPCSSAMAVEAGAPETPAVCDGGHPRVAEGLKGPPLWGPILGLAWAGGLQGFAAWEVSCRALGALLGGSWRAGETLEFVGAEAESPRQVKQRNICFGFIH